MFKLGFIINPVAGLGGSVALKGSDGDETVKEAIARGAKPKAASRALLSLSVLNDFHDRVQIITYPSIMGEAVALQAGFRPVVLGKINSTYTTAGDTEAAIKALKAYGVDLVLFAGGDGTARDICCAVGLGQPVLGIPCGVKMHSGVYAITPLAAGELVKKLLLGQLIHLREREVRDLDEDAFRHGLVKAKYFGELSVPEDEQYVQSTKTGGQHSEPLALQDIAADIIENLDDDTLYIVGSGSTTQAIMHELGFADAATLLGVDLIKAGELIATDVGEQEILAALLNNKKQGKEKVKAKIIVTIIGGQGHIFGRGNQQISAAVINQIGKDNIIVVATEEKLAGLNKRPLLVDTGDQQLDKALSGYLRVVTGYQRSVLYSVNEHCNAIDDDI